jgi:hypothetical protein
MASEVVRLSDVIVPEVYGKYIVEQSVKKTNFYRSGILATDNRINDFLAGGGKTFDMPFWQNLTGEAQAIQSGTAIETRKITTEKMVARRLLFHDGRSAEELAGALSGDNPMDAIAAKVDEWWAQQYQEILISILKGVIADNIANDSGDMVHDITTSGTPGTANKISSSAFINAVMKFGDAADQFTAIAMHGVPYATLLNANLITTEPTNTQNLGFGAYLGKTVIVTDELGYDTDGSNKEYMSIIFKPGALMYGESGKGITVVETDRRAEYGEDRLFTRRQFCMHPLGFKWLETSVAGDNPTRRELQEAGNWDRVFEKKNCGFVALITNG